MKNEIVSVILIMFFSVIPITAQEDTNSTSNNNSDVEEKIEDLKGKISGLEEDYLSTKPTVEKLSKIKISGYLQTQIRIAADTTGQLNSDYTNKYDIGEFQGGKFPSATKTVFQVRRARIKTAYETSLTQMVIQLDCLPFSTGSAVSSITQDTSKKVTSKNSAFFNGGGVSVKDAYLRFKEPWIKSIAIKAGIFDRPFGFEISYSSSMRESPERSRIFQTLFPGERDLGFSLEYQPSDNLPLILQCLNFKGGFFAGNGINIEFDDLRDFIGRLGFSIPLVSYNLSIDGGISGYFGKVRNRADSLYEIKNEAWAGSIGHKWKDLDRQYMGADLELFYGNIPVLGGVSLRGEYIQGKQPSLKSSNISQKTDQASKEPIYIRKFSGFYGIAVLNIDPIKCQLVGKYDLFDPNADLSGKKVKSTADMRYSTLGTGLIYHFNENVKLMAYYDMVKNEETSVTYFDKDVNDNVFTFRIQYKF